MSQAHQNPLIPFWRDGAEAEAAAKPPANSHAQFADRRAGMVAGANVSNRSHCDAMLLLQHSKVGSKPWMKPGSASEAGWRQELGRLELMLAFVRIGLLPWLQKPRQTCWGVKENATCRRDLARGLPWCV